MKESELLGLIAENMTANTMDRIFPFIAQDCRYYTSERLAATGRDEVCAFFLKRRDALEKAKISCFAYPARVEKSESESIPVGTDCVALAQFDRYNCVGFMTVETDGSGKITQFSFHTMPGVTFRTDAPGGFNICRVPADAHDAISFRAFAFGVMDEHVVLSRHVQLYDVFDEYVERIYDYIYHTLVNDFREGIMNAGGYMYVAAMAAAVERRTGRVLFEFDENESTSGRIPEVAPEYREWIRAGYEMGRKLFFGFNEYAELRRPEEDVFTEQICRSYLDMAIYGSVQANKDMDMGIPV